MAEGRPILAVVVPHSSRIFLPKRRGSGGGNRRRDSGLTGLGQLWPTMLVKPEHLHGEAQREPAVGAAMRRLGLGRTWTAAKKQWPCIRQRRQTGLGAMHIEMEWSTRAVPSDGSSGTSMAARIYLR